MRRLRLPSDSAIAKRLKNQGIALERAAAVLWFERGVLTREEMTEFANLVNKGVADIRSHLVLPESRTIRYYVSSDVELSHTSSRGVFLPMWRVQRKSAPYLHETVHALVPCGGCPLWFSEGFASFIQSYVSENYGGYDGVVFSRSGNAGIDREAREWLATERGSMAAKFIGRSSPPPRIARERAQVAAPFYVMSHSLVRFLVASVHPGIFLKLLTVTDFTRSIRRITGKSATEWKSEWLCHLSK